jgi:hypothetical protein
VPAGGGTGDDWIAWPRGSAGGRDADRRRGHGGGTDQLSYGTRTTSVVINKTTGLAGHDISADNDLLDVGDEVDTHTGFEIFESGSANDVLIGAAGAPADTFIPGDGDDDITCGDTTDTLDWSSSSAAMVIDPARHRDGSGRRRVHRQLRQLRGIGVRRRPPVGRHDVGLLGRCRHRHD